MTLVVARYSSAAALLQAAEHARAQGWDADTFSPYPLHGSSRALGLGRSRVPLLCLLGGLFGASCGYAVQWWTNAVDYPLNVANRAPHAVPSFVPITFELGILCAALATFVGLFAILGLPRPYHPLFEVPGFESASVDGFWLAVRATDPRQVADELAARGGADVRTVEERP